MQPGYRPESKVHHVFAPSVQVAAFRLGVVSREEYEPPYGIVGVILFEGQHHDVMPDQEGG